MPLSRFLYYMPPCIVFGCFDTFFWYSCLWCLVCRICLPRLELPTLVLMSSFQVNRYCNGILRRISNQSKQQWRSYRIGKQSQYFWNVGMGDFSRFLGFFCCDFCIVVSTGRGVMWNCVVGTDQSNFAQPFLWQLLTWIEARKFVLNQWMPEHLSENAFRTKTFPFWQPGKKCRPLNVLLKNCPTKKRVFRVICNWQNSSDLQIITASIIAKEM